MLVTEWLSQPGDVLDYRNAGNKRIAVPSLITRWNQRETCFASRISNISYIRSSMDALRRRKEHEPSFCFWTLSVSRAPTRYLAATRSIVQYHDEQSGIILPLVEARYLVGGGERRLVFLSITIGLISVVMYRRGWTETSVVRRSDTFKFNKVLFNPFSSDTVFKFSTCHTFEKQEEDSFNRFLLFASRTGLY